MTRHEHFLQKKTRAASIVGGILFLALITLIALVFTWFARPASAQDVAPIATWTDSTESPQWGYDFGALVRSDERGTAWVGARFESLTVLGGGDGLLTGHDDMRFWTGATYRFDEYNVAVGAFTNFGAVSGRLTWWPREFASLWMELGGVDEGGELSIVARFGIDVALPFDTHFEPGISLTYGTDQALGMDLFARFPIDAGVAIQGGMILLDGPDLPVWWRRANGDDLTGYISLTWRG